MSKFKRIMLIDDSEIDNLVNKHILTRSEITSEILVFNFAQDALTYFEIKSPDEYPELILLDINMPIMNGFGFLEEFNKISKEKNINISIFMLSSSVDPNDIRRSEEYDYVKGFISKPLSLEHIAKF